MGEEPGAVVLLPEPHRRPRPLLVHGVPVAQREITATLHVLDRVFDRTELLPSQAIRDVRAALRRGYVEEKGPDRRGGIVAWATGPTGLRYVVSAITDRIVVLTVKPPERSTAGWRRLAGPAGCCRGCGGALEVRGLACGCSDGLAA